MSDPLRILPEELRANASKIASLNERAYQVQGTLLRAWGRLDAGWDDYAESGIQGYYDEMMAEVGRTIAMLEQIEQALVLTTDTIVVADQATVGLFTHETNPTAANDYPQSPKMAPPPQDTNPPPPNYERFDAALEYMYNEMINNAQSDTVDMLRYYLDVVNNPRDYCYLAIVDPNYVSTYLMAALELWALQVHGNTPLLGSGPWDHKPILAEMLDLDGDPDNPADDDYFFPVRGDDEHEYYYDIWSNIHYGYVGAAAGFDAETLQDGASLGDSFTGTNDAADELSVQIGIELWEQYGTNLTPEQLHQAILDHTEEYLRIQEQGGDILVVDHRRNSR